MNRVYIEITNACNLHCSFCPGPTKALRQMTLEQFEHLIDQIKSITRHLYLHVQGEPLSHPKLLTFMDVAYNADLKVHLVSNATLLAQQAPQLFTHPALAQLTLSLHAWEALEVYSYKTHLQHLLALKTTLLASKASVFLRIWNAKSARMREILTTFHPDFDLHHLDALGKHRIPLLQNITLDLDEVFEWPSLDHEFVSSTGRCHGGRKMLAVLVDGTLTPCCLDPQGHLSIGNLFESPLDALISSQRYQSMVDGFKQGRIVEDLCQRCSYRTRFK